MSENKGFDLSSIRNTEEFSAWVDYSEDIAVQVRHIPREKLSGILKQATRTTWDKSHQPENTVDNIKYGELIGEAAIIDWTGITDNGVAAECTKENRSLVMRKWGNFAKFISDLSSDLDRLIEADKEAARKNLSTTSGPPVITQG